MSFSDTVKRVIELATAINDYWEAELRKRHPKYPIVEPGVEDPPPPPQETELRDLLRSLPRANAYKLLALASLGRGDFRIEELEMFTRKISHQFSQTDDAIDRLMSVSMLDADLSDALNVLYAGGIDIDHLEPSTV